MFLLTGAAGTQIGETLLTKDGGYATRFITGENLVTGEIVHVGSTNGQVVKNAIDADDPIGIVFESANQNSEVWVVHSGVAYVLPNAADTPTRAYVLYSSNTTAGRANQNNGIPGTTQHWREIGHWIESCAQGVICRALIHWN